MTTRETLADRLIRQLTVAAASLLVGVAAILLPNSVVVLALGGLVARGLYGLILGGES